MPVIAFLLVLFAGLSAVLCPCRAQMLDTPAEGSDESTTAYLWRDFLSATPLNAVDTAPPPEFSLFAAPKIAAEPATGLEYGAFAQTTFRPFPNARRSTAEMDINLTTNNQFLGSLKWDVFMPEDRYFTEGFISYLVFPEQYFGIGTNTTEADGEHYSNRRIDADIVLHSRLGTDNLYGGLRVMTQKMTVTETEDEGFFADEAVPGGNDYFASGLGYALRWETRENRQTPQKGHLLRLSHVLFDGSLGSTHEFMRIEAEARKYIQLTGEPGRDILALQALGVFHRGEPPFRMLALLGSKHDFRGYVRGRFRDRQYYSAQAEYRRELFWRVGATVFGGFGDVARNIGGFQAETIKTFYGAGFRFKMDRRNNINLRIDVAMNQQNTPSFYFGFGEAF